IGKYAFEGDDISHITIPSTVTTIGAGAFYNCRTLESVILYEGITYIDRVAFDACYSLATVYYVGTAASWQAIAGKSPSLPVTYLS
ncbi:MAG: leucine-rich repeat domain-containing protein, partial [Clostridia bacterium]|nr:leucine-rich repeat domain-containing protein [Clostridia bacterium]